MCCKCICQTGSRELGQQTKQTASNSVRCILRSVACHYLPKPAMAMDMGMEWILPLRRHLSALLVCSVSRSKQHVAFWSKTPQAHAVAKECPVLVASYKRSNGISYCSRTSTEFREKKPFVMATRPEPCALIDQMQIECRMQKLHPLLASLHNYRSGDADGSYCCTGSGGFIFQLYSSRKTLHVFSIAGS